MKYETGMIVMKNGHQKYGLFFQSNEEKTTWDFIDNFNIKEFLNTQRKSLIEKIYLEDIFYIDPFLT